MEKITKTNAMRLLDMLGVAYAPAAFESGGTPLEAGQAAAAVGADPAQVYKTLVTKSAKGGYFVFVVPANAYLNLKAAATATGQKSLEMLPQKDLLATTGYIKGGCSPVGMKKAFPTFLDKSAAALAEIYVSAGKRGLLLKLAPGGLLRAAGASYARVAAFDETQNGYMNRS